MHEYEYVGCIIIHKMKGQPAFTFSFSRKVNAVTIGQQSTIKIAADRTIDSALLFPTVHGTGSVPNWRAIFGGGYALRAQLFPSYPL